MKPTLKELRINYSNYLVKIRDGRLCFMCVNDENDIVLFSNEYMELYSGAEGSNGVVDLELHDYDSLEYNGCCALPCYDIVATKLCDSEIEPIRRVYSDEEPAVWDWCEEDDAEEMTLAEVCKALGKNIKIIKE